ncbi:MAG: DUF5050 domain-containing protein [Aggregatilineales bacterium]
MRLFRQMTLSITVLVVCFTMLSAQEDDSWITYIVDNQIYQMRADGTDSHLLTDMSALTMQWSADGEWFLIASSDGLPEGTDPFRYTHLFRVDADGTTREQITSEPILLLRHMALSSDSEWIVYTSCPDGYMHNCQLYKIRSDGTDFAHIDASPGYNQYLSWSPDSSAFLFSAYNGQGRNIYRMNPDEAQIEFLTEGWSMAWSPDGEWISFTFENHLYRMREDGSEREPLTQGLILLEALSWSPDSKWILFEMSNENTIDLYQIRMDGSELEPERLTNSGGMGAVWSSDGEWILFRSPNVENDDLYRMRADGSDLQQLTNTPENERDAQWIPIEP